MRGVNLLAIIMLFFIFPACVKASSEKPSIEFGYMDLSDWDFKEDGVIRLNGEWEFYWKQLLEPDDFQETPQIIPTLFANVPGSWNKYEVNGNKIRGKGYATYRLTIELDPDDYINSSDNTNRNFGLKMPHIYTSYRMWVNGSLVSSNGVVSSNEIEAVPKFLPQIHIFNSETDSIEIIIQVANFSHRVGGIRFPIFIGNNEQILRKRYNGIALDLFLIGCLFIMGFYHFGLYILKRNEKSTLFFSIVCFIFALRIFVTGEIYLVYLIPQLPWKISYSLEFLSYYTLLLFFSTFIYHLFRKQMSKKVTRVIQVISLAFIIAVLLTPPNIYTYTWTIFQYNIAVTMIYILYVVIKAVVMKEKGAFIILLGFIAIFLTTISDLMHSGGLHELGFIGSYGLLLFIFFQSFVLSLRFSKAFSQVEELSANLEIKVEERTHELLLTKNDLESKNKNIMESINYASSIQKTILPAQSLFELLFKEYFIIWKPRDVVGGDFYFIEKIEDKFLIGLADCTGHGVPGALMTTIARSAIHQIVEEVSHDDPANILASLNMYIQTQLNKGLGKTPADDGLDIGLCFVDPNKQEMIFSGAKIRLSYFSSQSDGIHSIIGDRQSVGYLASRLDYKYQNHVIALKPGMAFYLTSDGFVDQIGGEKGLPFGWTRLNKLLIKMKNKSLHEQTAVIQKALQDYQDGESQRDDITMMGFRF